MTPFQIGLIGAAGGIGALLGATITTRVGLRLGTGHTIIVCHVITTAGVLDMVAAGLGLPSGLRSPSSPQASCSTASPWA